MRRSWRELSSNCARRALPGPASRRASHRRGAATTACAMRWASSTGAMPGASSGRQRRQGRKRACSASCALAKKRQFARRGRPRRADGPAVDAGRGDADEEHAVEARIARRKRPVERAGIREHAQTVRRGGAPGSPFSDMTTAVLRRPKMASARRAAGASSGHESFHVVREGGQPGRPADARGRRRRPDRRLF